MRLSGSERIHSVRKKAGHSEAEEEIVSAAAEHSESGGTSAPESSLSPHPLVNLVVFLFFFSFSVGFLIFMADMAPNIKRKLWVLFTACLILLQSSLVCWLQVPVLIVLLLEIIPSSWLRANMPFLVLLGAFFLYFCLTANLRTTVGPT